MKCLKICQMLQIVKRFQTYKGALQKLETSNTIASQYLKTKNQKTQKKLSEGIVNTRLSAFGLLREVAIARALDTLYNDQQKGSSFSNRLTSKFNRCSINYSRYWYFWF